MRIDNTYDMTIFVKKIPMEDRCNVKLYAVFPGFPKIDKITRVTNRHLYSEDNEQYRYPSKDSGFVCFTSMSEAVRALHNAYHKRKEEIERKYNNKLEKLQPLKWYLESILEENPEYII